MLTELSVLLFSILLLPSLPNKVYTLFLYFSFFEPVFVISWSFSLRNEFHSFDLFYLPLLSSSRSKFSTFWSFSIRFCLCRLFLSIVIQWSLVFKLAFFLPQKYYISFRKEKLYCRFRFDFAITTMFSIEIIQNQFLSQTIYQGQNSDGARMRTAVDAYK